MLILGFIKKRFVHGLNSYHLILTQFRDFYISEK